MAKIKNFFIFALLASCFSLPSVYADELNIGGYYKNLLTVSNAALTQEGITADTQRLRLEFKKTADPLQFYLTLDNEAVFHDMAHTAEFDMIRKRSQQYTAILDMDKTSVDDERMYLRHSVYRAYVKYFTPDFQAVVGKQAIDWGKMRFYSPADLFNTVGPVAIEYDERTGVDAVNLNYSPNGFSGVNIVAVPSDDDADAAFGARAYHKFFNYDCAVIAARAFERDVFGVSFDGYIKGAGFRGEVMFEKNDEKRKYTRAALGLDYTFTEKFYVLLEYIYNGGADDNDPDAFIASFRTAREALSLRKQLSGLWLQYKLTPLLEWNNYTVYDWEGKSVVYNPELKYNITQNFDVAGGVQLYWGNAGSEFDPYENLYYFEMKFYF